LSAVKELQMPWRRKRQGPAKRPWLYTSCQDVICKDTGILDTAVSLKSYG
jgi:hypothetical protein